MHLNIWASHTRLQIPAKCILFSCGNRGVHLDRRILIHASIGLLHISYLMVRVPQSKLRNVETPYLDFVVGFWATSATVRNVLWKLCTGHTCICQSSKQKSNKAEKPRIVRPFYRTGLYPCPQNIPLISHPLLSVIVHRPRLHTVRVCCVCHCQTRVKDTRLAFGNLL